MVCLIFSAVGSVLYLFGGTNYPESEECLEGLYAYDIGKTCMLENTLQEVQGLKIIHLLLIHQCPVVQSQIKLILCYHEL